MPLLDKPLHELVDYQGRNPRPDDFDTFWDTALQELDATDPQVVLKPYTQLNTSASDCFDLYFNGVGGARLHAKYFRPKKSLRPHPAVLMFHGYTGHSGEWVDKLAYVAEGFCVAALDCRGQGGLSEDTGGVKGTTHHGHIIRGLDDSPEKLLFRQIFLDTAQLARIVMNPCLCFTGTPYSVGLPGLPLPLRLPAGLGNGSGQKCLPGTNHLLSLL